MAKFTLQEANNNFLTLPEDAIIQVLVESIEERTATNAKTGESWDKLNFKFKIVELPSSLEEEFGVLVGSTIFGSVAAKLTSHPDNKLRQWAEALLDLGDLGGGFELDTDMLVGRKARGVVGNWVRTSDGSVNHQIKGLLPLAAAAIGGSGSAARSFFDDEPPF